MNNIFMFITTYLIAFICAKIGVKLKVPGGAMVFSMIGVGIYNIMFGQAFCFGEIKTILQIFSGALIGSRIDRNGILALKYVFIPTIILVIGLIIFNINTALLVHYSGGLDLATSFFGTAPGGMSDMVILSADFGANVSITAILQLFRLLIILTFMPPIIKKITNTQTISKREQNKRKKEVIDYKRLIIIIAISGTFGMIFKEIGVMAGIIIGGMVSSMVYTIYTSKVTFPSKLKFQMQVVAGMYTGIRMTRETIFMLKDLIFPLFFMTIGIIFLTIIIAYIIHFITKLDLATCLLSCTPGGLTEMTLLSEDMEADTGKIAIIQTLRLFIVVLIFPTLITFFLDMA